MWRKWIPFCLKWQYFMETDDVHLTDEGTNIFAGNIVDHIRHFILKEF